MRREPVQDRTASTSKALAREVKPGLALLLCLLTAGAAWPRSYSTTFALVENPISEGGQWVNGGAQGLDWADVQVSPAGLAHGTQSGSNGYDDSTALLAGAWGPDQTVSAVVHSLNQQGGTNFEE